MIEIPWSPIACVQSCNPAASARIIRSRISETGCMASDNKPSILRLVDEWLKKIRGGRPREPSA